MDTEEFNTFSDLQKTNTSIQRNPIWTSPRECAEHWMDRQHAPSHRQPRAAFLEVALPRQAKGYHVKILLPYAESL